MFQSLFSQTTFATIANIKRFSILAYYEFQSLFSQTSFATLTESRLVYYRDKKFQSLFSQTTFATIKDPSGKWKLRNLFQSLFSQTTFATLTFFPLFSFNVCTQEQLKLPIFFGALISRSPGFLKSHSAYLFLESNHVLKR